MPTLYQVSQTHTQKKTLPLKVYNPLNVIISFLILHPISYTPLKYHAKIYNM